MTQLNAIILAAGKGTRMNSDLPKVLHPVAGRPMVHWVIDACEQVGVSRSVVVVGHKAELVREELSSRSNLHFVDQTEQLGTGHAVVIAGPLFKDIPDDLNVLLLYGDGPLIRTETLSALIETHQAKRAAATLATAVIDDPTGYGRIQRNSEGNFEKIVEQKDANPEQLEIGEVNPGYYCFNARLLFETLQKITNDNAKGEYYLTDVFELMIEAGQTVAVVDAVPPEDVLSINTTDQLQIVDRLLRTRLGMEVAG